MRASLVGAERMQRRLDSGIAKTLIVLKRRIDRASVELQAAIVRGLAAGTYGIFSRHGMSGLAGSVRVVPAEVEGERVKGGVEGGGGTTSYGNVFESGGEGSYEIRPVNAKALVWLAYGTPAKGSKPRTMGASGERFMRKQKSFGFTKDMIFRARVTHPPAKRRRWMGGAVADMKSRILEIVYGSAQEGFDFGG
jgi:hypothetical protein